MSAPITPGGSQARLRAAVLGAGGLAFFGLALAPQARAEDAAAPAPCIGRDLAEGADLREARLKRADDLVDAEGLLWRVEREGLAPSYLFGTIHSTDESAVALARKAAEFVVSAKVVATELGGPFDAVDQGDLAAKMLAKAIARDEDTFAPALTGQSAASVEAYLAGRGFSKELASSPALVPRRGAETAAARRRARARASRRSIP